MILRERLSAKAIAYLRTSPFVIDPIEQKKNECASSYILCTALQDAQGNQGRSADADVRQCTHPYDFEARSRANLCLCPTQQPSRDGCRREASSS
jgi:hypothetical protein